MKFLVLVILMSGVHVLCYNIDTKFPIIHSKPKDNILERNSYFGFSLILHKDWVQIGAPRANSTILGDQVMEPGVAYRCRIFGTCYEVQLDKNVNDVREDDISIKDLKNHSWIGGAMAMGYGEGGKVVVCGHRWKNQADLSPIDTRNTPQTSYAISGICFISTYYSEKDYSHRFTYEVPSETYDRSTVHGEYYGVFHGSQIGVSLHIAPPVQDQISLMVGAPGTGPYWTGGVVEYISKPFTLVNERRKRAVLRDDYGQFVKKGFVHKKSFNSNLLEQFSYFGYQVASGSFFLKNVLHHAASSPRGGEMRGLVVVYGVQYLPTPTIDHPYEVLEGQTFGEYFGGSLTVADVTGDGLDDLIVGAPLFSLQGDEGCIYVFTKHTSNKLREKNRKIGFKVGGRFGTAVASLGDIDQDYYDDIAVGAPYEGSGVIYIYNGSPNGLGDKPSQRIKAIDIYESLRGFGMSISRPVDFDGNKFADIAIGSYLSEHVVLLRSHPTIELIARMDSYMNQLNLNDTKFSIRACLYYNGSENVPVGIDVFRTVDVDVKFHRFKPIPEKPIKLQKRQKYECENITIEIKEEARHVSVIEDIKIVLSQRLKENTNYSSSILWMNGSSAGVDKFCPFCPVVKKNHTYTLSVPYARDCGSDDICVSNVELQCRLTQNDTLLNAVTGYVIGSHKFVKLIINISNHGEAWYSPKIKIHIPKEVNLVQIPRTCQEDYKSGSLSLTCSFGPFTDGQSDSINISMDLSAFETLRSLWENNLPLSFNIETISSGNHKNENVNKTCNIKLKLMMKADIRISGKSEKDLYVISNENDKKNKEATNVVHIYEMSNIEISPVKQVQTLLYVPVAWNEYVPKTQFSNPIIQVYQNSKTVFCSREDAALKYGEIKFTKGSSSGEKMEIANSSLSDHHPSNRTLYLNCSSTNVICETFKCNFFEFRSDTIVKILITSTLNMSILAPIMGHRDIVYFSTHGHVNIPMNIHHNDGHNTIHLKGSETQHDKTVSSLIVGTALGEKVQLWIIILCIIVGSLLILGIVMGLIKAGFFKRTKREELMALKSSENCAQ